MDIDGTTYPVYTLTDPGAWEIDFYREMDTGETGVTDPASSVVGQDCSSAGHPRYAMDLFVHRVHTPPTIRRSRVVSTRSHFESYDGTDWDEMAYVFFAWDPGLSSETAGKLVHISAWRAVNHTSVAHAFLGKVTYRYKRDNDGLPGDLGTAGDLIEVTKQVPLEWNDNWAYDDETGLPDIRGRNYRYQPRRCGE